MKLNVLEMGTVIKLNEDWELSLYWETCNEVIYRHLHLDQSPSFLHWYENYYPIRSSLDEYEYSTKIVIPKDTELEIDYYNTLKNIPNKLESVAFLINWCSDPKFQSSGTPKGNPLSGRKRFYARFSDCRNMDFEIIKEVI